MTTDEEIREASQMLAHSLEWAIRYREEAESLEMQAARKRGEQKQFEEMAKEHRVKLAGILTRLGDVSWSEKCGSQFHEEIGA